MVPYQSRRSIDRFEFLSQAFFYPFARHSFVARRRSGAYAANRGLSLMVLVPWYYFHRALFVPTAFKLVSVVRSRKSKGKINGAYFTATAAPRRRRGPAPPRRPLLRRAARAFQLTRPAIGADLLPWAVALPSQPGRAPPSDQDPSARHRPQAIRRNSFCAAWSRSGSDTLQGGSCQGFSLSASGCRLWSAYWCRHLRHGHEWPRDLIEQLIGILFLGQRRRQKLHDGRVMELLRQILAPLCSRRFRSVRRVGPRR